MFLSIYVSLFVRFCFDWISMKLWLIKKPHIFFKTHNTNRIVLMMTLFKVDAEPKHHIILLMRFIQTKVTYMSVCWFARFALSKWRDLLHTHTHNIVINNNIWMTKEMIAVESTLTFRHFTLFFSQEKTTKATQNCDCVQKNTLENCIKHHLKLVYFVCLLLRHVMDRLARNEISRSYATECHMQILCAMHRVIHEVRRFFSFAKLYSRERIST